LLRYIGRRYRFMRKVFVFSMLLWLWPWCGVGLGQSGNSADDALTQREKLTGRRVMQSFDFEEREIHFLKHPMYWQKIEGGQGFPHYSDGQLDTEYAHGGQYSFKLIPDGGSVAFGYDRRRIRVNPGSDSQISGYVHMEKADNCRAQLSCVLTDRTGQVIEGSFHSSALASQLDQGTDGWARLEVYIPGNFPDARYITVNVWLLQEEQWNKDNLNSSRVFQKNVHAVVWFDDITIHQLPKVILRTSKKSNVFDAAEKAQVEVEVEGVGALEYQARVTVHNAWGKPILDEQWVLAGVEGQVKIRSFDFRKLPAGIYYTRLNILASGTLVASRELTFAQLASLYETTASSGTGFGVMMMDPSAGDMDTGIELTEMLNAKLLKLPVWWRSHRGGAIFSEPDFDKKLVALHKGHIEVVATFDEVPDEMALRMDPSQRTLLDVLSQSVDVWRPQVAGVLAQYARQVPFWQIGADSIDRQQWDPRIQSVVKTVRKEFDELVSGTVLAVPVSGMVEVSQEQISTSHISLGLPATIVPQQIPAYLEDFRRQGMEHIWASIKPLDGDIYDRENMLIDFAKRIVYARKGQAEAIFIEHPWTQRQYNARDLTEPTELFVIFRAMADQLGGTRYIGQFNIAPDIPALIFDRNGIGTIFTWNSHYDSYGNNQPQEVELYLGDQSVLLDIFGNRQEMTLENGVAKLRLTNWPMMLSNVNTNLAALRASLQLTPAVIDASLSRQQLTLKFSNPFDIPVMGRLRFITDSGYTKNWSVDPLLSDFVLQPHQQHQEEITLRFPSTELGGEKILEMFFDVDADRSYRIRAFVPFEIRLSGVEVNLFTRRVNTNDLLLQQVVTNESEEQISLRSFVDLPDLDHLERAIPDLQPAATVTKSYLLRNVNKWLGQYIRIGLYDPKGASRINYQIEIN